jgi:hypothetical protein
MLACVSATPQDSTLHLRRLLFGRVGPWHSLVTSFLLPCDHLACAPLSFFLWQHDLSQGHTLIVDTLAHSESPNTALDIPFRIFDSLLAVAFDLFSSTEQCEAQNVFRRVCRCNRTSCSVTLQPSESMHTCMNACMCA